MSDERMSDKKWNDLGADLVNNAGHHKPFDVLVSKLFVEARRARAREVELTARVEELEAALTALNAYEDFSSPLTECDDCSSCCGYEDPSGINEARAKAHAALTPPTPKETE